MRASPFGAIVSHCQPTVSVTGSLSDGVEQVKTTSLPIPSAIPGAAVSVGTQVHSRPSTSVTVRFAIPTSVWSRMNYMVLDGCKVVGHDPRRGPAALRPDFRQVSPHRGGGPTPAIVRATFYPPLDRDAAMC